MSSTKSNTIKISACDNQLFVFAVNQSNKDLSYQICNIKSGNFNTVDVTIALSEGTFAGTYALDGVNQNLNDSTTVNLPAGDYVLYYAGINWGGPYNFDFTFNKDQYKLPNNPNQPLDGVIWSKGDNDITFSIA
ncbi:hypothetical protein [uncultured Lacinutrix sp.]|uniref:hypothetical protein n=1 Tax=uncultured Lacinutrix sp. TaxID=574032 RepID=UPI00260C2274|nr:hypothetical protein [uncultured Lacinutrix sp.]